MSFVWSQAAIDLLHRFYVEQGLSAAETAAALSRALLEPDEPALTRNAVLGKVQRMGWSKPPAEPALHDPRIFAADRRAGSARRPRPGAASLPALREIPLQAAPKLWTAREDGECAYPIGEPEAPGMQLCCAAATRGATYCPPHRALMLLPDTQLTEQDQAAILFVARRAA